MTHNQHFNIYIASDANNGGIYHYRADEQFTYIDKTELKRPQYMCIHKNKMFILLRDEDDAGKLISFDADKNGKLTNAGKAISTRGKVACHLCADDKNVYVANYVSGNVIKMPDKTVEHTGSSTDKKRQASPHAHFIDFTPDQKYLCVADLGLDEIIVYDKEMNFVSKASVPPGHGARHIAFNDSGDVAFCVNELGSSVSVFAYAEGKFVLKDTVGTLFENSRENYPAAIRVRNKYVYVSNRGDDSISSFIYDEGKLQLQTVTKTDGKYPRDFGIFGDTLICLNQNSDSITLFKTAGTKINKIGEINNIKSPVCVVGKEII